MHTVQLYWSLVQGKCHCDLQQYPLLKNYLEKTWVDVSWWENDTGLGSLLVLDLHHYTLRLTKLKWGYTGLSAHPSVCPSVCLWTESCPLCIIYITCLIHFIFTSYQATAESVSCVTFFSKLENLKICQNLEICNIDLFWIGIQYELVNSMGNHGSVGYPQNPGVLVVLVRCWMHYVFRLSVHPFVHPLLKV